MSAFRVEMKKVKDLFAIPAPDATQIAVRVWDQPNPDVPEINKDFVWTPALFKDLAAWLGGNAKSKYIGNVYFYGPTGAGKSTAIEQFAALLGIPVYRVACNRRTEVQDCFGTIQLVQKPPKSATDKVAGFFGKVWSFLSGNEAAEVAEGIGRMLAPVQTEYIDGPALLANENEGILLLDELDQLDPSQGVGANTMLDRGRMTILATGRTVSWNPGMRIAATGNSNGTGEGAELYRGVMRQNLAFMQRFGMKIKASYPDAATEEAILKKLAPAITETGRKAMVRLAGECRAVHIHAGGHLDAVISTRDLVNWALLTVSFQGRTDGAPIELALERVVLNAASTEDASAIRSVWSRINPVANNP